MTTTIATPAALELLQEDQARADSYALISRLFHAGPDDQLLAAIAGAGNVTDAAAALPLLVAWQSLAAAAATADAEAARHEYDQVFVGTGKAEITPYASHYLAEAMQERVLVRLRGDLAQMGLTRTPGASEYEDHLSGMCEVMRHLIGFDSGNAALRKQKMFFLEYLAPWYERFCALAVASPNTNFYKRVAVFTRAFLDVERSSFELI
jgi:TorA maturation chaperone TorD